MGINRFLVLGIAVAACVAMQSSAAEKATGKKAAPSQTTITEQQLAAYRTEIAKILAKSTREILPTAGGTGVALSGYANVILAKVKDDGSTERLCVDNVDAAEAFLAGSQSTLDVK